MDNKTLIKILTEINENQVKEIKKKIGLLEGVEGVKIQDGIIDYDLNEWASDYDVMVKILDLLAELNIEGEPSFDGELVIDTAQENAEHCESEREHGEHEHCECEHNHDEHENCECGHEHGEHEHCDCGHEHGEHEHCDCGHEHGFSCSCDGHENGEEKSEEDLKKERITKVIELSASLIALIVGIVLSGIEATEQAASYVMLVAYVVAAYETMYAAITGIFKGKIFTENVLMVVASLSAILLGEIPEAVGIMLLSNVGTLFEKTAIANVNKVVNRLKELTPETVTILVDGKEKTIKAEKVNVGDVVVIKPGERVGVDGKIIWGASSFNTSAITGESAYKDLSDGDIVLAGYLNVDGAVRVEVTQTLSTGTLSKIESAVQRSLEKKAKAEKFIEKFAKIYTPCVFALAVLLAFIPPIFTKDYANGLAIWGVRAVMLLCVSCPCSLVVSVPLTYYCGIGEAAKHGALIKSSAALERLASAKAIAFDKTGTLTTGNLKIKKIISSKKYQGKVLEIATAVEQFSNHPLALAIREKAVEVSAEVEDFTEIAGKGVTALYKGERVIAGNKRFLEENSITPIETSEMGIKFYLAVGGECAGVIVLSDEPRRTAYGAIRELYDCGIKHTVMLTGDNKEYASHVRKQLNMTRSYSELLPTDKVEKLELIMNEVKGKAVVAVGDGINDAPLLARADVSIAVGNEASAVTIESADIVLSTTDLSKVPYLVKLAKRTRSIVVQNVTLSILIKLAIMVLGAVGVTTSLWLAIGADVGVLILAILNAIRNRTKII